MSRIEVQTEDGGYTCPMTEHALTISDVRDKLEGVNTVMVTSIDEAGTLSSRPLTLQDVDINGDPWFLVDHKAAWVGPIAGAPVNVAAASDGLWMSFAGRARIDRDQTRIDALMDRATKAFFDSDSDPVALVVESVTIEWWAADGKAMTALKVARASITGGTSNAGTSGAIDVKR